MKNRRQYTVSAALSAIGAGDETHHARETIEAALAHKVGGVEGAYRRASAVEKRRPLMQSWADFCDGMEAKVVQLHG